MNKKLIKIYSMGVFTIALIIVLVINLVDFEVILDKAEEEVREKVKEVKEEVKEKVDAKKEEIKKDIEIKKEAIEEKIEVEKDKIKNKLKGFIDAK